MKNIILFLLILMSHNLRATDKRVNIRLCIKEIEKKINIINRKCKKNCLKTLTIYDFCKMTFLEKNIKLAGIDKLKLIPLSIELDSMAYKYNIIPRIEYLRKMIKSQMNGYFLSDNDTYEIDVNRIEGIWYESPFRPKMNIFDIKSAKEFYIHPADILETIVRTDVESLGYGDDFTFSDKIDYFLRWINHENDIPFIYGLNKILELVRKNKNSACNKILSKEEVLAFGTDNDPPSEVQMSYTIKKDRIISHKSYELSFKYLDTDLDTDIESIANVLQKYKIPVSRTLIMYKDHYSLKEENYNFGSIYKKKF